MGNILAHKFCFSFTYLPPANEVWGKIIFSEACVKNSVHGGGVPGPGGSVCSQGGCLVCRGVCCRGVSAPGGVCSQGGWWRPPRTATAAGGTHPTGMHSCLLVFCATKIENYIGPKIISS